MPVKSSLLFVLPVAVLSLSSCTTLENRRDMYFPQKVNGPYTRMVREWGDSKHPHLHATREQEVRYKTVKVRVTSESVHSGKDYVAPSR